MKILLVNPPKINGNSYIREGRCMQKSSSWAAMWMPLTLTYIASVLKENNDVKLLDCQAENISIQDFSLFIKTHNPNLVICNTGFPSIYEDLKVLKVCKDFSPKITTSIFGMYPTLLKENIFNDSDYLDYAVIGEPEWTYIKLVEALEKGSNIKEVLGIIYKDNNGNILKTSHQVLNQNDIEKLPFPSRELILTQKYKHPLSQKPFTLLSISRGCSYNCSFCNASHYHGLKFRKREIASIIKEIKECVDIYKIDTFLFWGESFSLDSKYAHELLDAIIESDLNISWSTRSMIDKIDKILLNKMKKAGCVSISIGIESINQNTLDSVNKKIQVDTFKDILSLIRDSGIISVGHFIFGLPYDNKNTISQTIKFALKSNLDFAQFYCATPYPETPFHKLAKEKKWIESFDYSNYHLANSVIHNDELSSRDIKRLRKKAYLRFYLRPTLFLRTLKFISFTGALRALYLFGDWVLFQPMKFKLLWRIQKKAKRVKMKP